VKRNINRTGDDLAFCNQIHFHETLLSYGRVRREGRTGWVARKEEWSMKAYIMRFIRNESGATAIEYGLIAAGISVAIIAVVQGLGTNLNNTFQSVSTALK
jgi:pilus assembly protein Flp/PilA